MDEWKSEDCYCSSGIAGGEDKEQRQIRIGYSFLSNENSFRLDKLIHNNDRIKILDLLNQSKISGQCGFPLTNPQSGESVDYVPPPTVWE